MCWLVPGFIVFRYCYNKLSSLRVHFIFSNPSIKFDFPKMEAPSIVNGSSTEIAAVKPTGSRLVFMLTELGKSAVKTEQEFLNIIHSTFPRCAKKWESSTYSEDGRMEVRIHLSYTISRAKVMERLRCFAPLFEVAYERGKYDRVIEGSLKAVISRMDEASTRGN
jgi:hypothetical protein